MYKNPYGKNVVSKKSEILDKLEDFLNSKGINLAFTEEGIEALSNELSDAFNNKNLTTRTLNDYFLELAVYIASVYTFEHSASLVCKKNTYIDRYDIVVRCQNGKIAINWLAILHDVIEELPYTKFLELMAPYSSIKSDCKNNF